MSLDSFFPFLSPLVHDAPFLHLVYVLLVSLRLLKVFLFFFMLCFYDCFTVLVEFFSFAGVLLSCVCHRTKVFLVAVLNFLSGSVQLIG